MQSEYNCTTCSGSSLSKGSWDGVVFFERRKTGAASTAGSYTRSHFRETQLVDTEVRGEEGAPLRQPFVLAWWSIILFSARISTERSPLIPPTKEL